MRSAAAHHAANASRAMALAVLCALPLAPGCANLPASLKGDSLSKKREKREAAVVKDFDERRDNAQYQAALARYGRGSPEESLTMLESVLRRNPGHLRARYAMAELLLGEDQAAAALEHIKMLREKAPDDASVCYLEGVALEALHRNEEALASYQAAVRIDPKNELFQHSLAAATAGGREPISVADSQRSQAAAASFVMAADDSVQSTPASNPPASDPAACLAAAREAIERNEPAVAVGLLEEALGKAPAEASLWRALGLAYYRSGEFPKANDALKKSLSLDSSQPLSYFLLGATLRQLGQTDEADRQFERAVQLDPRYAAWR